jgi:hypothetical protein
MRLSSTALRTLRAVIAAMRPRGHGFDHAIDEQVLRDVVDFFPHLPTPLRLGFPFGLLLVEFGPPLFARRFTRFSSMPRGDAQAYLEPWAVAGGLRTALYMGLRTLVYMAFYQHPEVLATLGVDWQGRADQLVQRRAEILRGNPA